MSRLPETITNRLLKVDRTLETLETPAVVIDAGIADNNLKRWQAHCEDNSLLNRPHIKTHRSVAWALRQLELGAVGITVQTVGEAEVMVEAGINDIFLTTMTFGACKLERLAGVARRCHLSTVADSVMAVDAILSAARNAGSNITVLIECDTGAARCGLDDPNAICQLAKYITATGDLHFGGLMTYPAAGKRQHSSNVLEAVIGACATAGISIENVTSGGSPDMWSKIGLSPISEYRAGTYIYNDGALLNYGTVTLDQCAMVVMATVVSRPTPDRAIIDAGSKALTSDLLGLNGYGQVIGYPDAVIYQVNEEHGFLDVSNCSTSPDIGERIRVLPNHTCVVTNLFDHLYVASEGKLIGALPVDARGKSS